MIEIKLLTISEEPFEGFEDFFDTVENIALDQVAPEVIKDEIGVKINGNKAEDYDVVFTRIPKKNAVFGRVLLEMIEEKDIPINISSTAFFIMAKKNYLYYILNQQGISCPDTVVAATEKAARNIHRELSPPLIGRKLENLEETEKRKLEAVDEIQEFAEGSEYEEDVLLFQTYNKGDKYRCLVVGDSVTSLKDSSESWKFEDENPKYSNLSDTQEELVKSTVKSLGAPVAEVFLRGEEIYDVDPNPDLELYSEAGGKNVYESIAEELKEEENE